MGKPIKIEVKFGTPWRTGASLICAAEMGKVIAGAPSGGGSSPVGSARAAVALAAGANNDLNPGGAWPTGYGRLILTAPSGTANVTGIAAGVDNQWLLVTNADSTNTITLNALNVGSAVGNRLLYVADLVLPPGASVLLVYDATLGEWLIA